jgi:plastocyanin
MGNSSVKGVAIHKTHLSNVDLIVVGDHIKFISDDGRAHHAVVTQDHMGLNKNGQLVQYPRLDKFCVVYHSPGLYATALL